MKKISNAFMFGQDKIIMTEVIELNSSECFFRSWIQMRDPQGLFPVASTRSIVLKAGRISISIEETKKTEPGFCLPENEYRFVITVGNNQVTDFMKVQTGLVNELLLLLESSFQRSQLVDEETEIKSFGDLLKKKNFGPALDTSSFRKRDISFVTLCNRGGRFEVSFSLKPDFVWYNNNGTLFIIDSLGDLFIKEEGLIVLGKDQNHVYKFDRLEDAIRFQTLLFGQMI